MTKSTHPLRIVTCCYCGARSQIGAGRHGRLVCHGCGAPIRRIEGLQPQLERLHKSPGQRGPKPAVPHPALCPGERLDKDHPARRRKGKRRDKGPRRTFWYHVREALDDFGDLDDILDIFD